MSEWKNLNEVQLVSPIHSKKTRDMWRETFSLKKIKVLLSKRELENAGQAANPVSDVEDFLIHEGGKHVFEYLLQVNVDNNNNMAKES